MIVMFAADIKPFDACRTELRDGIDDEIAN